MSVYVHCVRCGTGFDVGLGDDRDTCHDCRRVVDRLSAGGHPLDGDERAAVARLLGVSVGDDGAFHVDDAAGAFVFGDGGGFRDFAMDRRLVVASDGVVP